MEVQGLVKRYGGLTAVDGVTFAAEAAAVTAVLGPNGAGKTSMIECCEGLRPPDGGSIRVLGRSPAAPADAAWLRARVGVMLQGGGGLPAAARTVDVLGLAAALYAHPQPVVDLLAELDLTRVARTAVRRLSGGERQRLALAVALVGRPSVVFLDEPTAGLDPQARQSVWALIGRLRAAGAAVVLTTHLLDEAERLADQVVLIAAGRVVAAGRAADLTGSAGDVLRFSAAPGLDLAALAARLPAAVTVAEPGPGRYLIGGPLSPADVAAVTAWCAEAGVMPVGLSLAGRTLEDVFFDLAVDER